MVQITVDTKHDSTETLRRVITFLEEELRSRGVSPSPIMPPVQPMSVDTNNPFGSMFGGDDDNSNRVQEPSSPQPAVTPDMFSVFNHDAPSTTTTPSYETASSINQNMMSSGFSTPSVSQLLDEDDVDDTTQHLHHTQDLAQEVLQKGSTRKPDMPFDLEPYN